MTDHDQPAQHPSPPDLPAAPPTGVVISVAGELDIDTDRTAALDATLQRAVTDPASPREITVDVSGLGFCDSAGLNVLLRAQLTAHAHGRTLRLHGPNPQLHHLLHRTGRQPPRLAEPRYSAPVYEDFQRPYEAS
ncbi:STAS domain-containing protein [Streptomyces sp. NPDC001568]|uniref:STAS domain-containing protein n=1 Tax=Streptomyces sp. NPDC001568 TaxID=3364588 RepID=UPI00367F8AD7